jgi:hypothetical protein
MANILSNFTQFQITTQKSSYEQVKVVELWSAWTVSVWGKRQDARNQKRYIRARLRLKTYVMSVF